MRIWVKPDQLAKLNITVPEIINAVNSQNNVNPAGKIGGRPSPPGQEFTYTVRAQGRLVSEEEFGNIVLRATPDGSIVRLRDVARIELGAADYDIIGRFNGKPSAILALYQLPGSNAIEAAKGVKQAHGRIEDSGSRRTSITKSRSTPRKPVTEGIREIGKTFWEALALVMLVVFIFLQGWRAALIPLLAVPVSLVGTFARLPVAGLLHQHPVALRPGAGHRVGGGRRHRGGRSRGAPHRGGDVAQRSHVEGDGGGFRPGRCHRHHSVGGLPADGVHSRHHGQALSAIRRHHRHLRPDLRL